MFIEFPTVILFADDRQMSADDAERRNAVMPSPNETSL